MTDSAPVEHADAVVIGSGFGGSVSAYRLAEAGRQVVLLERGRAWPPGSFPRSPQHVTDRLYWDPSRGKLGIFDIWSFRHMEALVGAGLGGGSLIYANVLLRKDPEWFVQTETEHWPVTYDDLEPHYDRAEAMIGWQQYPFAVEPYASAPKVVAFHEAARANGWTAELPKLAVTFAGGGPGSAPEPGREFGDDANVHGVVRRTCTLCGECDAGCNVGAKNTLDWTILSSPTVKANVDLRTLCEVRSIAPAGGPGRGFRVRYVRHDPSHEGEPHDTHRLPLHELHADRVVMAAGTVGSTFLLLRNRSALPHLGPALGTQFCGNGDLLGFITHAERFLDPSRGPVITSYVRRPGVGGRGFYVEDAGYPEFLNWAWQVEPNLALAGRVLRFVAGLLRGRLTGRRQSEITGELGVLLGEQKSGRLTPLLGMGRDVPDGRLFLRDGMLESDWSMRTSMTYYRSLRAAMQALAAGLGARYRDNPYWWFRRVITVHPVGGTPMGDNPARSVVDSHGEAWHYPGLFVADGSVMPGPVGPNPSLTIAALADRFADRMVEPVGAGR